MKKVKLDLNELDVQSFPTTRLAKGEKGTVHANDGTTEASNGSACLDITCFYGCWEQPSEGASCTCQAGMTYYPCCEMVE